MSRAGRRATAEQNRVNSRLVASAQDLLDACKLAVAAMGDMDAARHIQRAIDNAEGRDIQNDMKDDGR